MKQIYNETIHIIEKMNGHKTKLRELDIPNKMLIQGNEISLVLEGNIEISFESTDYVQLVKSLITVINVIHK